MNTTRKGFLAGLSALFAAPLHGLAKTRDKQKTRTSGLSGMTRFPVRQGRHLEYGWEHKTNPERIQDVLELVEDLHARCRLERVRFHPHWNRFNIKLPICVYNISKEKDFVTDLSVEEMIKRTYPRATLLYTEQVADASNEEAEMSVTFCCAGKYYTAVRYGL